MKKKRKFADGGQFELSDEARAAGLSIGRNENIRPADRAAAIAETTGPGSKGFTRLTDNEAADLMEREVNMPEAVAVPVAAPRRMAGRALPPPAVETPSASRQEVADAVAQAVEGREPELPAPRRRPSPYTYGGPSPLDPILQNTPSARRNRRVSERAGRAMTGAPFKKGGAVKAKRGDGIAQRGKTKGRFV
jgi:hypothetical protein